MPTFNADIIAQEIRTALPTASVSVHAEGGDYDTRGIVIKVAGCNDDELHLCGFSDDRKTINELLNAHPHEIDWSKVSFEEGQRILAAKPNHVEYADIRMVQLRNANSDGGIQTNNPALGAAAATVRGLMQQMGFGVCNRLGDYF